MQIDFKEFVYYDETSPTFLRWKVDVYSGRYYRILEKAKDEVAGSLISSSGYAQVKINHKLSLCHRVIWELHFGEISKGYFIDHLDGDKFNNNITNLRLTTRQGNSRNCKKREDNNSGITGVHFSNVKKRSGLGTSPYWVACWFVDGRTYAKRFSVNRFGEKAKQMAIDFRKEKELELNLVGVAFTERHGK